MLFQDLMFIFLVKVVFFVFLLHNLPKIQLGSEVMEGSIRNGPDPDIVAKGWLQVKLGTVA